ncbi:MAG: class I SAM-dependent methyltransferase, partial [Candidatus Omnitrophica bacterium]|nr:class I SAM-dependent methyltransferase [Candidatus Omnitrophota bacterium]
MKISFFKKLIGKKPQNLIKKYNFSKDIFSSRIPLFKEILKAFKDKSNIHYLEIGVFEGRSFFWMLENILTHPTSTATGIDIFSSEYKKNFYENLKNSSLAKKVKIIEGFAEVELRKLNLKFYDIIYIDGGHTAPSVLMDSMLCWPLLKNGGILIFDDYLWRKDELPEERRPQIAIDA